MKIANLGAFGAGLVRGDIVAREQQRAEEDQAFQNEQRKAWREEQARQDEERKAVAALERPGEYTRVTPTFAGMTGSYDQQDAPTTSEKYTVTDADYARGLARAYKYSPEKSLAAVGQANQFDERQYQLHQRKVTDAALRAMSLIDGGDHVGGMRHLGSVYKTINDGKDIVEVAGPDGQPMFGLAQGGKYLQQPQVVTPEMARQAVWAALKFATPEMFKTVSTLENQATTANAAMRNAATMEGYRNDQRPLMQAQANLATSQAGYYDRMPREGAGNSRLGQVMGMSDDGTQVIMNTPSGLVAAPVPPGFSKLFPKVTGEKPPGPDLKFVKTEAGGYFANAAGLPAARLDDMGQFPMIPFGIDPRTDKKWPDMATKLAENNATLTVVSNKAGNLQWGFKSADGRIWSTAKEAMNPPQERVKLTPDAQRRVDAGETRSVGLTRN